MFDLLDLDLAAFRHTDLDGVLDEVERPGAEVSDPVSEASRVDVVAEVHRPDQLA